MLDHLFIVALHSVPIVHIRVPWPDKLIGLFVMTFFVSVFLQSVSLRIHFSKYLPRGRILKRLSQYGDWKFIRTLTNGLTLFFSVFGCGGLQEFLYFWLWMGFRTTVQIHLFCYWLLKFRETSGFYWSFFYLKNKSSQQYKFTYISIYITKKLGRYSRYAIYCTCSTYMQTTSQSQMLNLFMSEIILYIVCLHIFK